MILVCKAISRQQVRWFELPIRFAIARRDWKERKVARHARVRRGAGTGPPWIMMGVNTRILYRTRVVMGGHCASACPALPLPLCLWMTDKSRSLSGHGMARHRRHSGMAWQLVLFCNPSLEEYLRAVMPHKRAEIVLFSLKKLRYKRQKPTPTCVAHAAPKGFSDRGLGIGNENGCQINYWHSYPQKLALGISVFISILNVNTIDISKFAFSIFVSIKFLVHFRQKYGIPCNIWNLLFLHVGWFWWRFLPMWGHISQERPR